MLITPKTTLEEIKTAFPNHRWGLDKVNAALNAIKVSETYDVDIYENENGDIMIYTSERENA